MSPAEEFVESNKTFLAPEDMPECQPLKVWQGNQQDGTPVIISKWKPSEADLIELNNGGFIYQYIIGTSLPPTHLCCENPFYYQDNPPEIYK